MMQEIWFYLLVFGGSLMVGMGVSMWRMNRITAAPTHRRRRRSNYVNKGA